MSGSQIKQRDFPLIFYIPHKGQNTSQYSKEPGTDWSAHQSFLFVGPWHQKLDIKSGTIQNPTM